MEPGLELPVTKFNDRLLYFVGGSSILDFVVVLAASLEINFIYVFYDRCKYDLGNLILLQNKSDNNNNNNNNNNNKNNDNNNNNNNNNNINNNNNNNKNNNNNNNNNNNKTTI